MYFDETVKCEAALWLHTGILGGWLAILWPSKQLTPGEVGWLYLVGSEHVYFELLDEHCADLKAVVGGGVGWFVHIYSDDHEPGYGIYTHSGTLKFHFTPKTYCRSGRP